RLLTERPATEPEHSSAGPPVIYGTLAEPHPTSRAMTDASAIEVSGLVKHFGQVRALDGVDLTARHGEVLALLGPNGAGKTTLVRVLATLIEADAGEARVLGFDVRRQASELREHIGLSGQYAAVDEN